MMAPTHVMLGVAGYLGAAPVAPEALPLQAAPLVAAALGSLAPDIDDPKSWLGRRLFFVSAPLAAVVGHRGITHSLIAAAAATAGLAYYFQAGFTAPWAAAFLLGYLSHLFADWNTGGIPLLWPSIRRFRAPWAFQTGGLIEYLLSLAFCAGLLFLAWTAFKSGDLARLL